MNLAELRNAVREQLDLDEEDLPNSRLDVYLNEGFQRTVEVEHQWPFYAQSWAVESTNARAAMPTDLASLVEVALDDEVPLFHVGHDTARRFFSKSVGTPRYFSVWGRDVYLWPKGDGMVELRGYRQPAEWITQGPAAVPDCDPRLHLPIVHYACSREYAYQEDEVLTEFYLRTWTEGVESARKAIMQPTVSRPLIVGRGLPVRAPYNPVAWGLE